MITTWTATPFYKVHRPFHAKTVLREMTGTTDIVIS